MGRDLQLKGDIKYGGDLCHVDWKEADLKASLQWIVRKVKVLSELMTIDVLYTSPERSQLFQQKIQVIDEGQIICMGELLTRRSQSIIDVYFHFIPTIKIHNTLQIQFRCQ